MSTAVRAWFACCSLCAVATLAGGQYPQANPYAPYYPPPGAGGFGPGNTLNGAANVISSSGQLFIDQEQARVVREQANQAKVLTKRKTFDEMMYEKANTPAFTEDQEKTDMMRVRRVMNHPLPAEVTSGTSQNILLPYLDKLFRVGVQGPDVPLDQYMLRSINVAGGQQGNNMGLFRDGGKMDWPLALSGPIQKKLAAEIPKLIAGATAGSLDFDLYVQTTKDVDKLQSELFNRFKTEEIDAGLYLEGKRFMESLQSAMKAVRSPSAAQYLNNTYAATGRNVPELVYNMTSKGLKFAPATPGNEAPYYALQGALVSCAAGATSDNGFRATFDPLVQKPRKDFTNLAPGQ